MIAVKSSVLSEPSSQLLPREFLTIVEHPEAGTQLVAGAPWRMSGETVRVDRHSPYMGEHSFEVLHNRPGVSSAEYEKLVEVGVTGYDPP